MMVKNWRTAIPTDFADISRVWVYQNNRAFTPEEELKLTKDVERYVKSWMSHGHPVKGWGKIFFHQFIVLMADDTSDKLCGSAIDGSIRFMKKLEAKYDLELLNRMNLGFVINDEILTIPMNEVQDKINERELKKDSFFFNNTVSTKRDLLNNWIQPLEESFLMVNG